MRPYGGSSTEGPGLQGSHLLCVAGIGLGQYDRTAEIRQEENVYTIIAILPFEEP